MCELLTLEQIDKMPAGRETDALVAKVMGWRNVHTLPGGNVYFGEMPDDWNRNCWQHGPDWNIPHLDQVWQFSTEVCAAWMVDREGWRWQFHEGIDDLFVVLTPTICDDEPSLDSFVTWDEGPDKPSVYALARCRTVLKAALRLVEV